MKKIVALLFFISLCVFLYSQNAKIDSLRTLLRRDKEDTSKVLHLADLSSKLMNIGSYNSAVEYGEKAIHLAEKLSFQKGIVTGCNNTGEAYRNLGNFPKALTLQLRALKISEELGDKNRMASSYSSIGNVYYNQGNNKKYLECQQASLKLYQEKIGRAHV